VFFKALFAYIKTAREATDVMIPEYRIHGVSLAQPNIDKAMPIKAKEALIPNTDSRNLACSFFMMQLP